MENKEIIKALKSLVKLSELHGINPHKIKAYTNAIYSLERVKKPLHQFTKEELEKLQGVGKSISEQIIQLIDTSTCDQLQDLFNKTPEGILEIMRLPGIGAKKIRVLWQELNIDSLDSLQQHLDQGNLSEVKGFGKKTEENLKQALAYYIEQRHKVLLPQGMSLALHLLPLFSSEFPESRWEITGQLRRKCQIIDHIEFLAERKKQRVLSYLKHSDILEFLPKESSPYILRSREKTTGLPVWIRLVDESEYDLELFRTTGSPEHVESIIAASPQKVFSSEKEIYKDAGKPFYPPEIREKSMGTDLNDSDIDRLVKLSDLRGVLHAHSTYSDGRHTLREMSEEAKTAGYSYLGITDHSKSSFFYANGLFENRIKQQHEEIDLLNADFQNFKIFKGIECDILPDGSLDYTQDVLESFDFVICSVHSVLSMDKEIATQRLLKAIKHPCTTILGHLTGRLLLQRQGYPVSMEHIIEACAQYNVAIELNANPRRLDVDWEWIPRILESGVKISINPDAHSVEGYDDLKYGIYQARKAGVTTNDNLTSLNMNELQDYFAGQKVKSVSHS